MVVDEWEGDRRPSSHSIPLSVLLSRPPVLPTHGDEPPSKMRPPPAYSLSRVSGANSPNRTRHTLPCGFCNWRRNQFLVSSWVLTAARTSRQVMLSWPPALSQHAPGGSKVAPKTNRARAGTQSARPRVRGSDHRNTAGKDRLAPPPAQDVRRNAALCAERAGNHVLSGERRASERVIRPSRTCSSTNASVLGNLFQAATANPEQRLSPTFRPTPGALLPPTPPWLCPSR